MNFVPSLDFCLVFRYIFSTFFEKGSSARSLIPCFDEPSYKAKWQVTIDYPADMIVLGNMPDEGFTVMKDGWSPRFFRICYFIRFLTSEEYQKAQGCGFIQTAFIWRLDWTSSLLNVINIYNLLYHWRNSAQEYDVKFFEHFLTSIYTNIYQNFLYFLCGFVSIWLLSTKNCKWWQPKRRFDYFQLHPFKWFMTTFSLEMWCYHHLAIAIQRIPVFFNAAHTERYRGTTRRKCTQWEGRKRKAQRRHHQEQKEVSKILSHWQIDFSSLPTP